MPGPSASMRLIQLSLLTVAPSAPPSLPFPCNLLCTWSRWVGDCGRRTLSRGVRPLLSPDCTLQWLGLYDADMSSQQEREAFLDKIRHVYEEF